MDTAEAGLKAGGPKPRDSAEVQLLDRASALLSVCGLDSSGYHHTVFALLRLTYFT